MKPVSEIMRRKLAGAVVFPLFFLGVGAALTGCNPVNQNDAADTISNFVPVQQTNPTVAVATGDRQVAVAGAQLATPLTVIVTDGAGGSPISGVPVTFAVTGGGGSLTQTTVNTNASGVATTRLTLGGAGANTVTATANGSQLITFTETAVGTPTLTMGVGANAATAVATFESSIGGGNNGGTVINPSTGFRVINWDAVPVDGSDNSTVIVAGSTVGISPTKFQPRGVVFDEVYSVSADGFATVNPGVAGQFPAFSPTKTFAPFNGNQIGVAFVAPSVASSSPGAQVASAKVRGFGAIFLDVETANRSTIEYFNGPNSLGRFSVPTGASGQAEFLGALYPSAVVTNVVLTLGDGSIFSVSQSGSFTAGSPDITNNPLSGIDQVATDDFVYSEPVVPTAP